MFDSFESSFCTSVSRKVNDSCFYFCFFVFIAVDVWDISHPCQQRAPSLEHCHTQSNILLKSLSLRCYKVLPSPPTLSSLWPCLHPTLYLQTGNGNKKLSGSWHFLRANNSQRTLNIRRPWAVTYTDVFTVPNLAPLWHWNRIIVWYKCLALRFGKDESLLFSSL